MKICGLLISPRAFGALLLPFSLADCHPLFDRHLSAIPVEIQGEVTIQSTAGNKPLTVTTLINPDDVVQTSSGAQVTIALLPGIVVKLGSETKTSIAALRLSKNGDETIQPVRSRKAMFRLEQGTLVISVDWAQAPSHLVVQTPVGTVTADAESTARVTLHGAELQMICVRGAVNFRPAKQGAPTRVTAGFSADFPAGPSPTSAAHAGPKAQSELVEILREEKALRQRAEAKYAEMRARQVQ